MAKRLLNSEKNRRARAKYVEKAATANQRNIDAVKAETERQGSAWQKGASAGNDIVLGDREAPSAVFRPSKSGGGKYLTREGERKVTATELAAQRESGVQGLLAASGNTGKARTGADFGGSLDDAVKGVADAAESGDGIDVANSYIAGGGKLLGSVAPWLTEDMGATEAPQNLGQWLVNLLSTGTYVGARAVEGVADAVNAGAKRTEAANRRGDTLGASLSGPQTLGESVVNAIGGAGRGLAEGAGFRFDGERPRTHGQNLEDFGTRKALDDTLGEKGGQFAQGALGTVADIAGDPLTFATLGLTGVARGALKGGAEAAAEAVTSAGKVAQGTAGAIKGGWEGAAARRAEISNERFAAWQARQIRADQKRLTPEQFAAKYAGMDIPALSEQLALPAGRVVAEQAQETAPEPAQRTFVAGESGTFEPQNLDLRTDQLALPATASDYRPRARSVEQVQAAARLQEPVLRGVDEVLPGLSRTVTPKVDPARLLTEATTQRAVPTRVLPEEGVAELESYIARVGQVAKDGGNVARAVQGAMGQLDLSPSFASRLGYTIDEAGTTLRDLVEAALAGHKGARAQIRQVAAREIDETVAQISTPALRDAIDKLLPGAREALGVTGNRLHKLTYRLSRTTDAAKQQEILGSVLGKSYREGFPDFRAALAAVGRGELDVDQMTQMIGALGIKTRATKPATLRELLSTKGLNAYEDAIARIPTPEEIQRTFNITADEIAEAAQTDPAPLIAEAAQRADEMVAETPGAEQIPSVELPVTLIDEPMAKPPKPPVIPAKRPSEITPDQLDSRGGQLDPVGRGAYAGVRALGRMLKAAIAEKGAGNTLTSYTDQVSVTVHRAVVEQIKMKYLKKGGDDRAERFLPRYLEAMNLVEAWARGKGMIPHLVDNVNGTGDIWVSSTQVLELLDEYVVGAAMFAPRKNRKTAAAEGAIGYVNGMTLYPNHVMTGLKVALSGGDAATVAQAITARATGASRGMQRGTDQYVKAFAEKGEGKVAIARLAEELTRPDVLDAVREIDARVKPVAEAINQRYIDNVVARAGERIMEAVRDGGDRGTLLRVLAEVDEWAGAASKPALLDADRISASVRERLDSAIVKGVLGEEGFLTAQHDWAFAHAVERVTPSQRRERQARALAEEQARLAGRKVEDGYRPATRPAPEVRADVARAAEPEVVQAEATARAVAQIDVEQMLGRRLDPDADEALWREVEQKAAASVFEELGKRFSGRFGQDKIWGIRTSAEEGTLAQAAAYTADMRLWIEGTAKRMSEELGRKVKPQEALDHLNGPIFRALAATSPEKWGSRGELYIELVNGRDLPRIGTAVTENATFEALSEFDASLALELHRFIDHVFNPEEAGMIGRSGLTSADVASSSEWYLRGDGYEQFRLDAGRDLRDQATTWRAWAGVADSPLDVVDRTHQAIQAALVPQQIGHQMSGMFGHRAMRPGVATKQLYAEGWRRIDTAAAGGVGRFVDPDAYFPPEVLEQIRFVDEFLKASRGFDPEGLTARLLIKPTDQITRVLKSSNTIWRPGHHVTNVLGEFGMLLMAGVNPLQAIRAVKVIRAGGGVLDADMGILDELAATANGKKVASHKFQDDVVRVVLRDGRGGHKIEEVPLRTVWEWAANSGAALTHTAARDLVTEAAEGLARRHNPLSRADEALGRFSATRDNVTRIAHFIDALEKGVWANLDQAKGAAATKVHDYHPTVRTLSRFEQKYVRRLVFFYTWVRQAISRVLRTALDQPGLVTMPFKAQYNMAEAAGLNPESIGGPTTDDPRIASFTRNSLLGPTFADAPGEEELYGDLWSWSLSAPQIDTLQTLFGTFNQRPDQDAIGTALVGGGELGGDVLNPLLTLIPETVAEATRAGGGKSWVQILSESAGTPTALARAIPAGEPNPETGEPRSVYSALFPKSSGATRPPEEQTEEMLRYLINFATGLKLQNTTNAAAEKRAKKELREEVKRQAATAGVTDADQISEIRDFLWEWRMANQTRG